MLPPVSLFICSIKNTMNVHADEVAELDRVLGDGDHVVNLQRSLDALTTLADKLSVLDWSTALMKIGMNLLSNMGGASGLLLGSLFVRMAQSAESRELNIATFTEIFIDGVEAVKQRGQAVLGEKTMLDTLIPVANSLKSSVKNNDSLVTLLEKVKLAAIEGMESTRDIPATKGRASFLGERAIGYIDAGARTSQLMICAIAETLAENNSLSSITSVN